MSEPNENITSSNINESGCIKNQIPYKFFRLGVENKDLLKNAGDMYMGTGKTNRATVQTQDEILHECDIPETTVLPMLADVQAGDIMALECYNDGEGLKFRWVRISQNVKINQ